MANMVDWAKSELDRLVKDGDEMQKAINADILKMVETFSEQGHSGFSASYALAAIKRLLDWKPITPLTGDDDEWRPVQRWEKDDNTQQNKRFSAVFRKNFDNSTAYWIDGKAFSDDGGETWFTSKRLGSFTPITFPFHVPEKPEYVVMVQCPVCKGSNSDDCYHCDGYGAVLPSNTVSE